MKNIIRLGAFLLCVFYFTLPLVQCSQDRSYTATGWQIATGTGKVFSDAGKGYPFVFLLIIIPLVLLIATFISKSFAVYGIISISGLLAKIIYLIYARSLLNKSKMLGSFEFTGFNWLILCIYIGLCAVILYFAKNISISIIKNDIINKFNISKNNIINNITKSKNWNDILIENNLGEYIDLFEKNKLTDFTIIKELNENDLEKLGISIMGDRKKILKIFNCGA